jgi:hypothetical protein
MIPPGHKTWVFGNEPVVGIDFTHLEAAATNFQDNDNMTA